MKKIILLFLLIVGVSGALYLYIDTNAPTITWGVEADASINQALNVSITDDIGLEEVCFTMSGGACTGEQTCTGELRSQSFELLVEPDRCSVDAQPVTVEISVSAVDISPVANRSESTIKLPFDQQAPTVATLRGSHSLKQGGAGVVRVHPADRAARGHRRGRRRVHVLLHLPALGAQPRGVAAASGARRRGLTGSPRSFRGVRAVHEPWGRS